MGASTEVENSDYIEIQKLNTHKMIVKQEDENSTDEPGPSKISETKNKQTMSHMSIHELFTKIRSTKPNGLNILLVSRKVHHLVIDTITNCL